MGLYLIGTVQPTSGNTIQWTNIPTSTYLGFQINFSLIASDGPYYGLNMRFNSLTSGYNYCNNYWAGTSVFPENSSSGTSFPLGTLGITSSSETRLLQGTVYIPQGSGSQVPSACWEIGQDDGVQQSGYSPRSGNGAGQYDAFATISSIQLFTAGTFAAPSIASLYGIAT